MLWPLARRFYSHSSQLRLLGKLDPLVASQPLRILFCGSDEFSAISLQRLHQESLRDRSFITSIDVVCKAGKPAGRGLRTIRHVPIKHLAHQLELSLHEIPTFTGWTPNIPYNLIIAVSFGLLVPRRILKGARFGGLNLHPSLLPNLRGPAPLHHTLLNGLTSSGVSLQTLHPEHFDCGRILSTAAFDVPEGGQCSLQQLRDRAALIGADLLVDSLRKQLHVSSITSQSPDVSREVLKALPDGTIHARKICREDSHVDWLSWSSDRIFRTQRALGTIWSQWPLQQRPGKGQTSPPEARVQWHGLHPTTPPNLGMNMQPGKLYTYTAKPENDKLFLKTVNGELLTPESVTIEGRKREMPPSEARKILVTQPL